MSWNDLNFILYEASTKVIAALQDEDVAIEVNREDHVGPALNPDHIEPLTLHLQLFIAHVVAGLLDAGSERDAMMEDEALRDAILNQLKEWT
jgi:hypothetical protein